MVLGGSEAALLGKSRTCLLVLVDLVDPGIAAGELDTALEEDRSGGIAAFRRAAPAPAPRIGLDLVGDALHRGATQE